MRFFLQRAKHPQLEVKIIGQMHTYACGLQLIAQEPGQRLAKFRPLAGKQWLAVVVEEKLRIKQQREMAVAVARPPQPLDFAKKGRWRSGRGCHFLDVAS